MTTFEIAQVNIRRMQRGKEAVEINVIDDGKAVACLWMSKRDIELNIADYGECDAFTVGLEIYKQRRDVREATQ